MASTSEGASAERQDYGTLSARSVITGPDGRAAFAYIAPRVSTNPAGQSDPGTSVAIRVTPRTADHANALGRSVVIRLVPPGRVIPEFRVVAGFTFAPVPTSAHDVTLFRAPYCDVTGASPPTCLDDLTRLVTRFAWSFGDGTRAAGQSVSHVFEAAGSYPVRLTVTDSFGRTASETLPVTVDAGALPVPAFDVSPILPTAGAPSSSTRVAPLRDSPSCPTTGRSAMERPGAAVCSRTGTRIRASTRWR